MSAFMPNMQQLTAAQEMEQRPGCVSDDFQEPGEQAGVFVSDVRSAAVRAIEEAKRACSSFAM